MENTLPDYLDLLDTQRETAFAALDGLTQAQIWQRPAAKEWCIGEILDHNYLLIASTLPIVRWTWKAQQRRAQKRRERPYSTDVDDPYHKKSFPHWVGFLWTPRWHPKNPVPLEKLFAENRELHAAVREFYIDKDPGMLGNIFIHDPLIGSFNLIATLRIGIYHDQLHFDDILKMAAALKEEK